MNNQRLISHYSSTGVGVRRARYTGDSDSTTARWHRHKCQWGWMDRREARRAQATGGGMSLGSGPPRDILGESRRSWPPCQLTDSASQSMNNPDREAWTVAQPVKLLLAAAHVYLLCVLAALLPIQLPATMPGKAVEAGLTAWPGTGPSHGLALQCNHTCVGRVAKAGFYWHKAGTNLKLMSHAPVQAMRQGGHPWKTRQLVMKQDQAMGYICKQSNWRWPEK